MKWFNKIKQWFQEEEIIEIEEIIIDESNEETITRKLDLNRPRNNDERAAVHKHVSSQKSADVDAKILYQYPKGKFKFPVIPDDEQNRDSASRLRKQGKSAGQSRERNRGFETKKQQTSIQRHEKTVKSQTNKIKPSSQPFRPTEIPSPIYGFKKPQRAAEEVVEFELNSKDTAAGHITEIPAILRKEGAKEQLKVNTSTLNTAASLDVPDPKNTAALNLLSVAQTAFLAEQAEVPVPRAEQAEVTVPRAEQAEVPVPRAEQAEVTVPRAEQAEVPAPRAEHTEVPAPRAEQAENTAELQVDSAETTALQISSAEPPADDVINHNLIKGTFQLAGNVPDAKPEEQQKDRYEGVRALASGLYYGEQKKDIQYKGNDSEETNSMVYSEKEFLTGAAETEPVNEVNTEANTEPEESLPEGKPDVSFSGTESKPKKHIPFNVVMLKQDRERMAAQGYSQRPQAVPAIKQAEVQSSVPAIGQNIQKDEEEPYYILPKIDLLTPPVRTEYDDEWLDQQAELLNETLLNFNVRARVVNVTQGPSVTRFEVQPEAGVKVNKVTNLQDDIKLSLAAEDIRMEAPIPGKHTIGIEIPNRKSKPVFLREVLQSEAFQSDQSPLTVALGLDISGQPVVTDLKKMPHGLIAGATGSGKSVCINTMLVSLLYKASPQDLKLLLIDPKMVELAPYNRIPHLVSPVITDVKAATAALKWTVDEMERRYELFAHAGVRDITRFNSLAESSGQHSDKLPYIVVIIDELADLMMMSPAEVEEAICRIAQKARACGIHLIVATQRPSVDVITGLIKANIPTRIAFSVSSQVDSRTIIDSSGAEKLLGKGDMLFAENGSSKTVRLQGTFVNDDEIDLVVSHVRREQEPQYLFQQEELLNKAQALEESDELFFEACEFVVSQNAASTSSLQRRFHVGYNRAARLIDMMEKQGIISESRGSRPRDVLISVDELEFLAEANPVN
ncbi:DNA translocase FtsK [Bacillus sp. M6-12]|nr:DNA translocase FtsK [Bacillus sp. M6-12]PLS14875.1 DNA translocase FtsK [Bacillus sp. M6-12]